MMDYELLDSGDGKKLERFKDVCLIRSSATAIWPKSLPPYGGSILLSLFVWENKGNGGIATEILKNGG